MDSSSNRSHNPETSGFTRGQLLHRGIAAGLAVGASSVFAGETLGATPGVKAPQLGRELASQGSIRPFQVKVPKELLAALRRQVAATRLPSKELVTDRSQGVQLATIQALSRFWTAKYDWRAFETKLNALPQFRTRIDGVDVHFIHIRSKHKGALPLIMTHGWPGSIVEMLEVIDPLTNPTAHGGRAQDAFDLVLPSIPGYGFSGQPTKVGWDHARIARAWTELMRRLGYTRYVAQGGDVGAAVTDQLGRQAAQGLIGIHLNLLPSALSGAPLTNTAEERAAAATLNEWIKTGKGYFVEQNTRPQTIGYALLDSPVALAAWMLDHDTDSYEKISRAFLGGPPAGNLTRRHILDNITLYWLTGTGASAARSYWEAAQPAAIGTGTPPPVKVPVGFSAFPGELFQAPRSWVELTYPTLAYYNKPARGGHFAAWEQPALFTNELRAAFRPLR